MRFGRSFGLHDHEIEAGVYKLIARVMHSTVTGISSIERADLVEALTGYKYANPICREDLQVRMAEDLRKASDRFWPSGVTLRRKQWDEISHALFSEQHAILFLVGEGGSGKTTALLDWATQRLKTDPPQRPYIAVTTPKSAHSSLIAEIVADWSELSASFRDRRDEEPEVVIERLRVASPNMARPILILGLDGLDETSLMLDSQDCINRTIKWFQREDEFTRDQPGCPAASLIVTLRDGGDIEDRYFAYPFSGFASPWKPRTIHFGDFSPDDLREAFRVSAPRHLERYNSSVRTRPHGPMETIDDLPKNSPISEPHDRPIEAEILASLHHPAMWRAFLELHPVLRGP